ncbi:MAG TPA: ATP-binding SpoIIE family protein phosphatase [Polyangia bacterium]|nr:ATP-binding SpoIIE family protein phosphatase [Polyangia bacterium]
MSGVGEARRLAAAHAEAIGFSETDVERLALVVTEASTNLVQHGGGGELLLRSWGSRSPACGIELLVLDQGPGMANVSACMRDGFSTGGSQGVGLGAIARLSTTFDVFSAPGKGTAILACLGDSCAKGSTGAGLEWGAVCVAKREEEVSGDAWAVRDGRGLSTILVVDGLGHGPLAFDAAGKALLSFGQHPGEGPESLLRTLDAALQGTRGAAAGVAEIQWAKRELHFAGLGNIAGALLAPQAKSRSLVSHNGTAGQSIDRIQEFSHPWPDGGILVMHSDGLSNSWELEAYPGLSQKPPSLIAGVLYRDFVRRRDDVVVVVARERV